jgi:uncharacterized membrane protein
MMKTAKDFFAVILIALLIAAGTANGLYLFYAQIKTSFIYSLITGGQ